MAGRSRSFAENLTRALRLPFILASALPFVFGSLAAKNNFDILKFLLGLTAALAAHLSANLINDYADSSTGADWQDKTFYGFFGGSKLIQEGVFSEAFYLRLAIFFAAISGCAVIALSVILKNISVIGVFLAVIFLSWSYSMGPLRFSYRKLGELIIFILFGPALVMGGYYLQTGIFPDLKSFMLSLPFGFLTAAILYANEIPDLTDDKKVNKITLVGLLGLPRACIFYYLLIFSAFSCIILNVIFKYIGPLALLSLIFILTAFRAALILQRHYADKTKLVESSRLTVVTHALVSLVLILGVIL